eukprot:366561-Chlamydomonas_euryale.AAC.5
MPDICGNVQHMRPQLHAPGGLPGGQRQGVAQALLGKCCIVHTVGAQNFGLSPTMHEMLQCIL